MKNSGRKNLFLLITLFITVIILVSGCASPAVSAEQSTADEISEKWVPDSREGICSISVTSDKDGSIILHGETNIPQARDEIIKTLDKPGIKLIDSILILPDTTVNKRYHGLVSISVTNMRKEPSHSSEMVSQAILGTPVLILKKGNYWSLVQTPDNYISWTETSSVKLLTDNEISEWRRAVKVIFLENSGWVYTAPDAKNVVGDLVSGSILVKIGESKGYTNVIFPDGREGYISSTSLADFNNWKGEVVCNEEHICKVAETFLGLPYLWGASSSKAVDCSGFVQSVFFRNGLILSRDASLQAEHGIPVDPSGDYVSYRRGDLLFFGTRSDSKLHITHVAIYKGDSEYIHASGRVMINSLDSLRANYSSFRRSSLLAVRRIVGFEGDQGVVPVVKHSWY